MTLRRIAAPTEFPVSLLEAKAQCQVLADDFDEMFLRLIQTANEVVSGDVGLVLAHEIWELKVTDPVGTVTLPLAPVSSIVSVNGGDASGYTLSFTGDCATVSGAWPPGEVVIRFAVGGDVPFGLKQAMLMLIRHWFEEERGISADGQAGRTAYAVEALVGRHRRGWVKA